MVLRTPHDQPDPRRAETEYAFWSIEERNVRLAAQQSLRTASGEAERCPTCRTSRRGSFFNGGRLYSTRATP